MAGARSHQAYKRAIGLKTSLEKLRDALAGAIAQQQAQAQVGEGQAMVPSSKKSSDSHVRIRPVSSPPSTILEEIEVLIPIFRKNASALRPRRTFCMTMQCLEERQVEMKRIVETAFVRAQKMQNQPVGGPGGPGGPGGQADQAVLVQEAAAWRQTWPHGPIFQRPTSRYAAKLGCETGLTLFTMNWAFRAKLDCWSVFPRGKTFLTARKRLGKIIWPAKPSETQTVTTP